MDENLEAPAQVAVKRKVGRPKGSIGASPDDYPSPEKVVKHLWYRMRSQKGIRLGELTAASQFLYEVLTKRRLLDVTTMSDEELKARIEAAQEKVA